MKTKITHLTSAHPRYDIRIFIKECVSLSKNGFDVSLVVADGKGEEEKNGVYIFDVGSSTGRLNRMLKTTVRVFRKAIELNSDVYHLHDPELIPIGLKLKKLGKKVIFDAHEDVPKQLLGKPYLNYPAKLFLSKSFSLYECWALPRLDAVIAATDFIEKKYKMISLNSVAVNNYPLLEEFSTENLDWSNKNSQVLYIGGLEKIRGIKEIVQAIGLTNNVKLVIGGKFNDTQFKNEVVSEEGWSKTNYLGWLDREEIQNSLKQSIAGLVTLHPMSNYLDSMPVKMFEYMAAGIPVISSNFPVWEEIINDEKCGLCVDPLNPQSIATAIEYLVSNPEKAQEMGRNGLKAVTEKYNWAAEEKILLKIYREVLS